VLDFIIKETAANPTASVIWLHGFGSDGNAFAGIVPRLKLPQNAAVRFIFPHAPIKPISKIRTWFDVVYMEDGVSLDFENNQDIKGVEESSKQVKKLIDAEIEKGIHSENILLIGFSQGAVVAFYTAMHYPKKLGGAAILSSHLPKANTMPLDGVNAKIPVLIGHGNYDGVVPPALSEKAFEFLKLNGNTVERHTYNVKHSVCLAELKTLGAWIARAITL